MACRRTAVVLSCLAAAGAHTGPWPKGKCDDASPASGTCCDADQTNNAKCVEHVRWAMGEGASNHADWYEIYDVHKGDTFANFQCALFFIAYNKAHQEKQAGFPDEHHACARPCTATVLDRCSTDPPKIAPPVKGPPVKKPEPVLSEPHFKKGPSFKKADLTCPIVSDLTCECDKKTSEWKGCAAGAVGCVPDAEFLECPCTANADCSSVDTWMIVLIVLLLLALVAALAYFSMQKKEKAPKKKKRALKAPPAPEPEAPAPLPVQPASFTMAPTMMMQAPPPTTAYHMQAQPVQTMVQHIVQPQPVQTHVQTYAAPAPVQTIVHAQPVQSMVQTYAAPTPVQSIVQPQPVQSMVQTYAAPAPQSHQMIVQPQMVAQQQQPMVQYAAPGSPVQMHHMAPGAFNMMDTNGDGVISRAEFANMMR